MKCHKSVTNCRLLHVVYPDAFITKHYLGFYPHFYSHFFTNRGVFLVATFLNVYLSSYVSSFDIIFIVNRLDRKSFSHLTCFQENRSI